MNYNKKSDELYQYQIPSLTVQTFNKVMKPLKESKTAFIWVSKPHFTGN